MQILQVVLVSDNLFREQNFIALYLRPICHADVFWRLLMQMQILECYSYGRSFKAFEVAMLKSLKDGTWKYNTDQSKLECNNGQKPSESISWSYMPAKDDYQSSCWTYLI